MTDSEIVEKAAEQAAKTVFRDKLDPSNASGQGVLLSKIDDFTSTIFQIGHNHPLFRWIVPFVQTPMNILKQGVEYSPLGFATLKGATDKTEQLAKASVGSLVFLASLGNAINGNSTWKAPLGTKNKQLFYAAGKRPYSVRIGNNWVSYSKLGPIAYPMALAAALHYVANEQPKANVENMAQKSAKYMGEMALFFGDQSYIRSLGLMAKAAQGDWRSAEQLVGSLPTQLIPLSALQRWINNIIDPYQRQSTKEFGIKPFVQEIMKSGVGLSQFVPKIKGERPGEESLKPSRFVNLVSPLPVSLVNPLKEQVYQRRQWLKQIEAEQKALLKRRGFEQ